MKFVNFLLNDRYQNEIVNVPVEILQIEAICTLVKSHCKCSGIYKKKQPSSRSTKGHQSSRESES